MIGRIAALVALAIAVIAVVILLTSGGEDYEITAEFQNAGQLVKGNEVVVGGRPRRLGERDPARPAGAGRGHLLRRRRLRAAAARHHGHDPQPVALPDRRPPGPAHPARVEQRRVRDPRRRHAGRVRDRLGRRPRPALQHALAEDDQGLQARDPGTRRVLRGRRAAGQPRPQVPEPVPLDLAPGLRRAQLRPGRVREPDRRLVAALGRAGPARAGHLGPRREPEPDDERDRRPQGAPRAVDLRCSRTSCGTPTPPS